jgi:hypothetical protein
MKKCLIYSELRLNNIYQGFPWTLVVFFFAQFGFYKNIPQLMQPYSDFRKREKSRTLMCSLPDFDRCKCLSVNGAGAASHMLQLAPGCFGFATRTLIQLLLTSKLYLKTSEYFWRILIQSYCKY